jgi:hypothetical protein
MKKNYTSVISFLIIIAAIYYSFTSLLPSEEDNNEVALTEFSTKRALVHLKKISQNPHYVGTDEHEKVKNYLVSELQKMNLYVEIQNQIGVNEKWRAATKTQNILARIQGSDNHSKALVLLTHYDSAVHSSFGASDAGSGVVTILEGIRAFLATNKQPKNDIIILFTDAEEVGLLGANAFVNHHPWAKEVGLVLNFEARGSGGPSYMLLETNGGNKNLIKAFNKAKPNFPVANSLMYSIYKMLPNDTDLTVFREDANLNGFNFAFIDDHFDYHTAQDTYENLDKNTLAQQGDYLMTMLNYFANENLENLNEKTDDIYFSFPKLGLITYPFSWVLAMFILAIVLFFVIVLIGLQRRKLITRSMFAGFVPFLSSLIISGIFAVFGWKLLKIIHPQYNEILHGFTYNGHLYIIAFSAITLGICFWLYKRYFQKHNAKNLLVAPLFIWGLINLLIVLKLKGAGFFILPVYIGLISLAILVFSKESSTIKFFFLTLISIPIILVFAPLVKMFPVGLGLKMLVVSAIFIVLLFGLLIPLFHQYKNTKKLSYLFFLIGIIALLSASLKSDYSEKRKQPTSLNYIFDADENKAYWATYESKVNDFNKEYLSENPTIGSFKKSTGASKYKTKYKLHKKTNVFAPEVLGLPPIISTINDSIVQNKRIIHLQIIPQRNTNRLELKAKGVINFYSFKINGQEFSKKQKTNYSFNTEKRKTILSYYFTEENEILDLEFIVPETENLSFTLYDISYDLFTNKLLKVKPRNNKKLMPTPFVINDATIIKKDIKL